MGIVHLYAFYTSQYVHASEISFSPTTVNIMVNLIFFVATMTLWILLLKCKIKQR